MKRLRARVELGELALHVVERARELPELVGGVDREARREVAAAPRAAARSSELDARGERAATRKPASSATISAIAPATRMRAADERRRCRSTSLERRRVDDDVADAGACRGAR